MNGQSEDLFRSMICSLQINDLQALLAGVHYQNISSDISELKNRALELLRSRPEGFDHQLYLIKIFELYRSRQIDTPGYYEMLSIMQSQGQQQNIMSNNTQQLRMYQPAPPNNPRQSMQRDRYVSYIPGNNIRYRSRPAGSCNIRHHVSSNQQVNAVETDNLQYVTSNANAFTLPTQYLRVIRLKKLPYYEVVCEIMKPISLVGQERSSLPNTSEGMREEATFKIYMSAEQINLITLNRNYNKNEYLYQLQIRFCLLEPNSTELTDFLPLALKIKVNNKVCPLPPTPKNQPGTVARKMARPIHCSNLFKLCPFVSNTISVNWTPDAKTYVMAVHLVKYLSPSTLLQKLKDKEARSSVETKNYIIKSLADVVPDVAATSYRFSLLCPLGKKRMRFPAKSINCVHIQCFDAHTFISINEKYPSWLCPICSKPCLYDDIQIQTYFLEVVSSSSLPDSSKEIKILPDGTWQCEENKEFVKSVADKVKNPIESVILDGSDDDNFMDVTKEANPTDFIDLTLSDDEPPKDEDKQEKEAQVQPQ